MNLCVSFMYLNTAPFMVRFISSVKSAFPFTNKSNVTTGIKLKESAIRLFCSVRDMFGVFEDSSTTTHWF